MSTSTLSAPIFAVNTVITIKYFNVTWKGFKTSGWSAGGSKNVTFCQFSNAVMEATIKRATEKALMIELNGNTTWVPISKLKHIEDNIYQVGKGFCSYCNWPTWSPVRQRPVFNPVRQTVL